MCLYEYMLHVCWYPWWKKQGVGYLEAIAMYGYERQYIGVGNKTVSLQECQVLLSAGQSLQPSKYSL